MTALGIEVALSLRRFAMTKLRFIYRAKTGFANTDQMVELQC
jgi:hypothetical protein